MGFDFPIRSVAGDIRGDGSIVEPFYFLRNGWKIRPQETSHTLLVTGNIELDQGETGQLFVPTLGAYTVLVTANTTNRGTLLSGGGGTDWTSTERAQIRHRLGLDGSAQAPAATPSLARPGDAMALTSAERLAIMAVLMGENVAGLQASAHKHSLLSAVLKLVSRFDARTGTTYRLDGTTPHMAQSLIEYAGMKPISEIGVAQ